MKRLNDVRRRWLRNRSKNEWKRKDRDWQKASFTTESGTRTVRIGNSRKLPPVLCLNQALDDTLAFFYKFRAETKIPRPGFSRNPTSKKRGKLQLLKNFYDFESLKIVSPGAALILAAEFDRTNWVGNAGPSSINIHMWDDTVYGVFYHLGFFQVLGFSSNRIRNQAAARPPTLENQVIMPMESGTKAELEVAATAIKSLIDGVAGSAELAVKLNSNIFDAVENVVQHAYDDLPIGDRKYFPRKWWISGAASLEDKMLTLSIYDQGVTIPFSLPIKWNKDKAFASIMSIMGIGPWKDNQDGEAIRAAMLLSTTSTKIGSRGKGLHKIKEIMGQLAGGNLAIISRRGYYTFDGQTENCRTLDVPLLGTYVEFRVTL